MLGIGVGHPTDKLTVDGTVRAREVKVESVNWPDYVFDKDYTIFPIPQLKTFLEEYKHLPGIPSAKEVHKTGINLSTAVEMLLKKIEELNLYIIDQHGQIVDIQNKLRRLED